MIVCFTVSLAVARKTFTFIETSAPSLQQSVTAMDLDVLLPQSVQPCIDSWYIVVGGNYVTGWSPEKICFDSRHWR